MWAPDIILPLLTFFILPPPLSPLSLFLFPGLFFHLARSGGGERQRRRLGAVVGMAVGSGSSLAALPPPPWLRRVLPAVHRRRGAAGGLLRSHRPRSRPNRQGHSTGIRRTSHRRRFVSPRCRADMDPPRRRGSVMQAPPAGSPLRAAAPRRESVVGLPRSVADTPGNAGRGLASMSSSAGRRAPTRILGPTTTSCRLLLLGERRHNASVSSADEDAGKEDDKEQDLPDAKEEAPRRSKRSKHSNPNFYGPKWAV